MDFTPITTQEEFDAAISERLRRERESFAKKLSDYEDLKSQAAEWKAQLDAVNSELDAKKGATQEQEQRIQELMTQIKSQELAVLRNKIAVQSGIPFELAERLSGDDEASIRKDAETIAKLVQNKTTLPPLKSTEPSEISGIDAAYKSLLNSLKGE